MMECEQCGEHSYKYKCPKCGKKTCGLPCVQRHKKEDECSGKRDRTEFVDIHSFSESVLRRDFSMLEDVARTTESADRFVKEIGTMRVPNHNKQNARGRKQQKKSGSQQQQQGSGPAYVLPKLPPHLHLLLKHSKERGVNLRLMPKGMQRHAENSSRYDGKQKLIKWRIEWKFPRVTPVAIQVDGAVKETTTLLEAISEYLEPTPSNVQIRHRLRPYMEACKLAYNEHKGASNESTADYHLAEGGIHALKFYYQHPFAQRGQWKYVELTPTETIQDLLRGQTIIEFPTIFVDIEPSYLPQEETKHSLTCLYPPVKNDTDTTEQNDTETDTTERKDRDTTERNDTVTTERSDMDTAEEHLNSHTVISENEEGDHGEG